MSYCTFEINNGELIIKRGIYKGIASTTGKAQKTIATPELVDEYIQDFPEPEYGSAILEFDGELEPLDETYGFHDM